MSHEREHGEFKEHAAGDATDVDTKDKFAAKIETAKAAHRADVGHECSAINETKDRSSGSYVDNFCEDSHVRRDSGKPSEDCEEYIALIDELEDMADSATDGERSDVTRENLSSIFEENSNNKVKTRNPLSTSVIVSESEDTAVPVYPTDTMAPRGYYKTWEERMAGVPCPTELFVASSYKVRTQSDSKDTATPVYPTDTVTPSGCYRTWEERMAGVPCPTELFVASSCKAQTQSNSEDTAAPVYPTDTMAPSGCYRTWEERMAGVPCPTELFVASSCKSQAKSDSEDTAVPVYPTDTMAPSGCYRTQEERMAGVPCPTELFVASSCKVRTQSQG